MATSTAVKVVAGVAVTASLVAAIRLNNAPPANQIIQNDHQVQATGATLLADREREQEERAKLRCTTESAELMRDASRSIERKDPAAAVSALRPCLDTPDAPAKIKALHTRAEKAVVAKKKADALAEAKLRKSRGVHIGMTPEEAIASSWGKPHKINRTTTRRGTREQWVYGGGNYLYFEDDILVSFQN